MLQSVTSLAKERRSVMTIQFQCPQCAKSYELPDEMAGKTAKCGCGAQIAIPAPAAADPLAAAPVADPLAMPPVADPLAAPPAVDPLARPRRLLTRSPLHLRSIRWRPRRLLTLWRHRCKRRMLHPCRSRWHPQLAPGPEVSSNRVLNRRRCLANPACHRG